MRWCISVFALAVLLGLSAIPSYADSVPVGEIVFDVNIPSSGSVPGVNSFTLYNLTGGALSPSPGIQDALNLSGQLFLQLLQANGTTTTNTIAFSGVSALSSVDLFDITSSDVVLSAVLTGTLSSTIATLNGATSPTTLNAAFTVFDPFNGGIQLSTCSSGAGPCMAEIDATTIPTSTPEPGTLALLGSGISGILAIGFFRRRCSRGFIRTSLST
jgi:hypothetical protein